MLTIELLDADTKEQLAGMVRVTNLETGKAVKLPEQIHRALNWYSLLPQETVVVPKTKLQIEGIHGIETELTILNLDTTFTEKATVQVFLRRFYDPPSKGILSGNTHLHLMEMTYAEALNYLATVPKADGLDLVYLSHLRRVPNESQYISN